MWSINEFGQVEWKLPAQRDEMLEETMHSETETTVSPLVTDVVGVLPENAAPKSIQQPVFILKPSQQAVFTVEELRNQMMSNQISSNSFVNQNSGKELNIPTPQGKGALCHYCGYVSILLNKCQRCKRKLVNPIKLVDLSPPFKVHLSTKTSNTENIVQKNVKGQKPKARSALTVLNHQKDKVVEEINEEPEAKKSRKEVSDDDPKPSVNPDQQLNPESCPTLEDVEIVAEFDKDALDLKKWKEVGLKGNCFPVSCYSVWIESYRMTPIGRILISQEGIVIQVPILLDDKPHPLINTKLVLTKDDIGLLNVHFGRYIPSIFMFLTPAGNEKVRKRLKCCESDAWFDIFGQNEKQKRIVLMLDCVTDEAKRKMMEAFTVLTSCVEINAQQANRILMLSAPPRSEPETEQPDDKLLNMKKWKDAEMNGRYYLAVNCRFAWIGSYRVIPVGWILLSAEGILMEIPVMNADGTPSAEETVLLTLSKSQILKAEANFTRKDLPAIFLYLTPEATQEIRDRVRMSQNVPGLWFDPMSIEEQYKRFVILLRMNLPDETEFKIQQFLNNVGDYSEIGSSRSYQVLAHLTALSLKKMEAITSSADVASGLSTVAHVKAVQCTYPVNQSKVPSTPEDSTVSSLEDENTSDLLKWKQLGMTGHFFAIHCLSARIGSYRVDPIGRVLISDEGIAIEVPVLKINGTPSSTEMVKLILSKKNILKVGIPLCKTIPAMFIYLTAVAAREVRSLLRMPIYCPGIRFDPLSNNESEKKIILFPDQLTDEVANGIQKAIRKMGVYKRFTATETIDMLIRSCCSV